MCYKWLCKQNWFSFYSHLCLVSTVYHKQYSTCKIWCERTLYKSKVVVCADKNRVPFPSALWILLIRALWKNMQNTLASSEHQVLTRTNRVCAVDGNSRRHTLTHTHAHNTHMLNTMCTKAKPHCVYIRTLLNMPLIFTRKKLEMKKKCITFCYTHKVCRVGSLMIGPGDCI